MNISIEQKKINATLPKMLYISKIRYLKSKQLAIFLMKVLELIWIYEIKLIIVCKSEYVLLWF